jgi:hypothetical protein
MLNQHIAEDGPTVFAHASRLGAEGTARAMGFGLGEHGVIPQNGEGGPHVVDNGLIMGSGMGMVVKPGAFSAPSRLRGLNLQP